MWSCDLYRDFLGIPSGTNQNASIPDQFSQSGFGRELPNCKATARNTNLQRPHAQTSNPPTSRPL